VGWSSKRVSERKRAHKINEVKRRVCDRVSESCPQEHNSRSSNRPTNNHVQLAGNVVKDIGGENNGRHKVFTEDQHLDLQELSQESMPMSTLDVLRQRIQTMGLHVREV
jgi:hypothetical protein